MSDQDGIFGIRGPYRGFSEPIDLTGITEEVHVGGVVTVLTAGDLRLRDYQGTEHLKTGLALNDTISSGGNAVLIDAILPEDTTVTSIEVAYQ